MLIQEQIILFLPENTVLNILGSKIFISKDISSYLWKD